jgi:hypothetical protein
MIKERSVIHSMQEMQQLGAAVAWTWENSSQAPFGAFCRAGKAILWALPALALSSCVITPMNTHMDQRRSIARYDSVGIEAPVSLPELQNGATDEGFSAPDFLTLHSGMIVSGEYVNEDFKKKMATTRDSQEGVLELGFSVPIAPGGSGFGSCAPVTADGYFITAAHVLAHEENFVLYATSSAKKTFIDYAPLRVVFRNEEADFAIVKTSIKTPRYLKFRTDPLKRDTVLFAGGWMHEKGGGHFLDSESVPGDRDGRFTKIVTTLPMIKGDSGSPLIDQQGHLCGTLSTMRLGVVVKLKPKSTAVMMKPSEIESIIARDRAGN